MIKWHPVSKRPPMDLLLLLWHVGAKRPAVGYSYFYTPSGKWNFSTADARGVKWTHWALVHNPRGKVVKL